MSHLYKYNLAELKKLCAEFDMLCIRHDIKDKWYVVRDLNVLVCISDFSLTFERWALIEKRIMTYVIDRTFLNDPN